MPSLEVHFAVLTGPQGNKALGAPGSNEYSKQLGGGKQNADVNGMAVTDERRWQGQNEPRKKSYSVWKPATLQIMAGPDDEGGAG